MTRDLQRFVDAQANSYSQAIREIKNGRKESHWMWYIFPQLHGLGSSPMADFYGLESLNEAKEYLRHPILGIRLKEIIEVLINLPDNDPRKIFGTPDDLKLRSSMTLFNLADADGQNIFKKVLEKFFDGKQDDRTVEILRRQQSF